MKTSTAGARRILSEFALVLGLAWALPACHSTGGAATMAVPAQAAAQADTRPVADAEVAAPTTIVPSPQGGASVQLAGKSARLQRRPGARLEDLIPDSEDMYDIPLSALWSPAGTRVCILCEGKRWTDVRVFTIASQPATEVELDLQVLLHWQTERYSKDYLSGRFYYIKPLRWINEDQLEIEFSGNLLRRDGDGDPANSAWFKARARIALGAQKGAVQGAPEWLPLETETQTKPPATSR